MRFATLSCLIAFLLSASSALARDQGKITFWNSVNDSRNVADLRPHDDAYWNDSFASARIRSAQLSGTAPAPSAAPAAPSTPAAMPSGSDSTTATATGWRYAKWGMTEQQLIAASNGLARAAAGREREQDLAEGTYIGALSEFSDGPFQMKASFYFANAGGGLGKILVELKNMEMREDFIKKIQAQYGRPFEDFKDETLRVSKWRNDKIEIWLADVTLIKAVTLMFRPVAPMR
jgi:hypothetical protein